MDTIYILFKAFSFPDKSESEIPGSNSTDEAPQKENLHICHIYKDNASPLPGPIAPLDYLYSSKPISFLQNVQKSPSLYLNFLIKEEVKSKERGQYILKHFVTD